MKMPTFVGLSLAVLGMAACSNIDRSRNLHDSSVAAKTLAQQVCSNCHGMDGNATSPNFPNLAGQTEPYLIQQLKNFRARSRSDPAGFEYMWGISRHLTDAQIEGLAAYFTGQKPVRQSAEAGEAQVSSGKKIFEGGVPEKNIPACMSCHGDNGQGNAQFPRIAGQHVDYLLKQLMVFQRTDERPEATMMKVIAHDLTRKNMEDVAAFLQVISSR